MGPRVLETFDAVRRSAAVLHGANLGYIPVIVKDACGFGHRDAADTSIASLEFACDAQLTNVDSFCAKFGHIKQ
jgi:nicotinamidase-related amidase